ncbi:MAG: hypothetical protein CMH53_00110, partial [Myxococcales bacterium]|nr:hypothetical protein [Myxococcales bacterium]
MISALSFSSRDRDAAEFPDANRYELDVGRLRAIREIRLAGLEMPTTHMTIEEGGDNRVHFSEGLQVPSGPSAVQRPTGEPYHHNELVVVVDGQHHAVALPAWRNPLRPSVEGPDLYDTRSPHGLRNYFGAEHP